MLHENKLGRMVCYQPPEITDVTIAEAIGQLKRVNPACSAIQTGRGLGISFGDSVPKQDARKQDASSELSIASGLSMPSLVTGGFVPAY